MEKKTQINVWYFIFALIAVLWLQGIWSGLHQVERIPYSEFLQYLREEKIESIEVYSNRLEGTFRDPLAGDFLMVMLIKDGM